MLLSHIPLSPPPIKFPLAKCPKTNVVPLFANNLAINRFCGKSHVFDNGYTYFTSPENAGIGILNFFEGKNILVTGATGLLGKVLVEKILRSTLVGKIYLLIKAKDKEAALGRLTNEIINSDLFKCLKQELDEDSYEAVVREKLIPIAGNICEPNLGMDYESIDAVRKDVDVIIQSAANTAFNERYDLLLDANMNAPKRLMRFAKTCKNLKLFSHISTAYVNGRREGVIFEEPLIMGGNGINEDCVVDIAEEINMILKSSSTASTHHDVTKNLKKLGQERATLFGWYNSYHMTKAMGEVILDEIRGDVPLLIIRPTIIESIYNEPIPGRIQGNRMFDSVIIAYGKGRFPAFLGNSEVVMDIIPVDMVANTIIAAIAKEGNIHKPQLNVNHVASSVSNPITIFDAFEYLYEYFKATPHRANIAEVKFFDNFDEFSKYTREEIFRCNKAAENAVGEDRDMIRKCNAKVEYAEQLCKKYEFAGFFKARFHTGNTQKLIEEMSKDEQLNFEVDVRNIDWKKYFEEIHVPGLKRYVINSKKASSI